MQVEYITRARADLKQPNRPSPYRATTTGWVGHHSATTKPKSIDESIAQWQAIQNDHLNRIVHDKNGNPVKDEFGRIVYWADIAYNLGIGYRCILVGRGISVRGGGTGQPWDNYTISICILGSYDKEAFTDDFRIPLIECLRDVRKQYGNELTTNGDRDFNSTQCPGDNLYPHLDAAWAASGLLPQPVPTPTPGVPEEDEMVYFQMVSDAGGVWTFGPNGAVYMGNLPNIHGRLNDTKTAPVIAQGVPEPELQEFAERWMKGMK